MNHLSTPPTLLLLFVFNFFCFSFFLFLCYSHWSVDSLVAANRHRDPIRSRRILSQSPNGGSIRQRQPTHTSATHAISIIHLRHADAHHLSGPPCVHTRWLLDEEREMVRITNGTSASSSGGCGYPTQVKSLTRKLRCIKLKHIVIAIVAVFVCCVLIGRGSGVSATSC